MLCFRHPDRPAIGICRHCGRGLCTECAVPVDEVLACKDSHEPRVAAMNRLLDRNILQATRTASGYLRNGVFYGLVGAAFVALGISQLRFLGLQAIFFALVGAFLLYAAVANLLEARRFR